MYGKINLQKTIPAKIKAFELFFMCSAAGSDMQKNLMPVYLYPGSCRIIFTEKRKTKWNARK